MVAKLIANNMVTCDAVVPGEGLRVRQYPDRPEVAPLLPALTA